MFQTFIKELIGWVKNQADILAVALVGSRANGKARENSDVDLVMITNSPDHYINSQDWVSNFGKVHKISNEDWGILTAKRVFYESGLEIEYGITSPEWAKTDPVDSGTERIINDGFKILLDKNGILKNLIKKLKDTIPELQNYTNTRQQITIWPSKPKLQDLVLKYLADKFEIDKEYDEKEINEILNRFHTFSDPALLRRELYEKKFFDREPNGSKYIKLKS